MAYAFEIGACDRPDNWAGYADGRGGCGNGCGLWMPEESQESKRERVRTRYTCDCGYGIELCPGRYLCQRGAGRGIWTGQLPVADKIAIQEDAHSNLLHEYNRTRQAARWGLPRWGWEKGDGTD